MMALITIDTNVVIHALAGNSVAVKSIDNNDCLLSFITVIELLSWKQIENQIRIVEKFLSDCLIKDNDPSLQKKVIAIRLKYGLKIPDAFIAATALQYQLTLISGDPVFKRISEIDLLFLEF